MRTIALIPEALEGRRLLSSAFSDTIDNPYMPMIPGTTFVYHGFKGGERESDLITVTGNTSEINGVTTTDVLDRVYVGGTLAERTHDFFAQDKIGNVWY